jgi:hypothetical protein
VGKKLVLGRDDRPRLIEHLSTDQVQGQFETFRTSFLSDQQKTTEELADGFAKLVFNSADSVCKVTSTASPRGNQPQNLWYDSECKVAKRRAHDAARQGYDNNYVQLKSEYKRITQCKKRRFEASTYSELEHLYSKNQTDFWKLLKKLAHKSSSCPIELNDFLRDLRSDQGTASLTLDAEVDDFILSYFSNEQCTVDERFKDILDRLITHQEVLTAALQQKCGKSTGADGIPTSVLQCFVNSSTVITDIF